MIKIIAIGKKHESWVADGIERYQKRCKKPWEYQWILLPHSRLEGDSARQEESGRIISRLNTGDYIVLLDERGTLLDSPQLSQQLGHCIDQSKPITLVIGGAYGVSEALIAQADIVWSLSPLVFPHQLVRLIVSEQLYRAQEIAHHRPYHHD